MRTTADLHLVEAAATGAIRRGNSGAPIAEKMHPFSDGGLRVTHGHLTRKWFRTPLHDSMHSAEENGAANHAVISRRVTDDVQA